MSGYYVTQEERNRWEHENEVRKMIDRLRCLELRNQLREIQEDLARSILRRPELASLRAWAERHLPAAGIDALDDDDAFLDTLAGGLRDGSLGLERRTLTASAAGLRVIESRSTKKPTQLVGYAAKYDTLSEDLGGFREKIAPGTFNDVIKTDDVRCLKNHDPNLLLGRSSSGTMRLSSDAVGLRFEVDLPATSLGRDVAEEVRRGDLSGCSFAFRGVVDHWENGVRTITAIRKLYDVGPVAYPAYPDTAVAVR